MLSSQGRIQKASSCRAKARFSGVLRLEKANPPSMRVHRATLVNLPFKRPLFGRAGARENPSEGLNAYLLGLLTQSAEGF